MKIFIRYPLLVFTCLAVLAGCGGTHDEIIGKWHMGTEASTLNWEFSKDGSVLMGTIRGKYSFGDSNRMKIQSPLGTSVYQLEMLTDRMILKDPNGSKLELTRLK